MRYSSVQARLVEFSPMRNLAVSHPLDPDRMWKLGKTAVRAVTNRATGGVRKEPAARSTCRALAEARSWAETPERPVERVPAATWAAAGTSGAGGASVSTGAGGKSGTGGAGGTGNVGGAGGSTGAGGSAAMTGSPCANLPAVGTWQSILPYKVGGPAFGEGFGEAISVDPFDTAIVWLGTGSKGSTSRPIAAQRSPT